MEHPGIASPWAPPRAGGAGAALPWCCSVPPFMGGVPATRGPRVAMAMALAQPLCYSAHGASGLQNPPRPLGVAGGDGGDTHTPDTPTPGGAPTAPAPPGTVSPTVPSAVLVAPAPRGACGGGSPPTSWLRPGVPNMGGSCYINTTGSISCCLVRDDGDVNGLQGAEVAFWGALELCPPLLQLCKHLLPGGRALFGGAVP